MKKSNKSSEKEVLEVALELLNQQEFKEAISALNTVLDDTPTDTYALRLRGLTYYKLHEFTKALNDINEAIKKGFKEPVIFRERAMIRLYTGELEEALRDVNFCIEKISDDASCYSLRSSIHYRLGEISKAVEDIKRALVLRPGYLGDLHNLALIYTFLNRYDAAIEVYNKVLEQNSKSGGTYNNLAWIYATAKDEKYRDGEKAISLALKALESGRNGAWLDTLAAAYAESGKFEKAYEIEEEAYRVSKPKNKRFLKRMELYKQGLSEFRIQK